MNLNIKKVDIGKLKSSCELAAETLMLVDNNICEGISTEDINVLVHDFIIKSNGYPSPLHYHGFPKSVCTSRNNVMCHGIPHKKEILKNGDIINVDVTTYFPKQNGFHGDTSVTFLIGNISSESKSLVKIAYDCLKAAIGVVKPGARFGDIGYVISKLAKDNNFSVSKDFIGHGVGKEFHSLPNVYHTGNKNTGEYIKEGMVFTIEPIINSGTAKYKTLENGWTVVTQDGKMSAQFEHTILVTKYGSEILTKRNKYLKNSIEYCV